MKKIVNFLLLLVMLLPFSAAQAQASANPEKVVIPGTIQSELGCSGDWMPDCENTALVYDAEDDIWQGTFLIPPGSDQDQKGARYKAAINGAWSENYGLNAIAGGGDIPLAVKEPTEVKFYYDHKTHWVTDSFNTVIAVASGDFQQALGCASNNDAGCLRSWLQDPDGDGMFAFSTTRIPAGTYSVAVALYEDNAQIAVQAQEFTVADNAEVYFGYDAGKGNLIVSTEGAPRGNITKQQAHWVTRDTILWKVTASPRYTYKLHYSAEAGLVIAPGGILGGEEFGLTFINSGVSPEILARFPHLKGASALSLADADLARVPELLTGQVAVSAWDQNGKMVDATGLQIPGVLDGLYRYEGALGVSWENSQPVIRLWAPTAQKVSLIRFVDSSSDAAETIPMSYEKESGVWSVIGQADWKNQFYLFEVQVFVPSTGLIEKNLATDPYSFSLSTNGRRSQIVDLNDPALKPAGWDTLAKPALAAPEDIVLYELHVRDFSASDPGVPDELRGTFKAFTVSDSNGMKHLKRLAEAGLTHVHLLPAFDIASVNEDKSTWKNVDEAALAALPGDSDAQQAAVGAVIGEDGFNWGYDPHHYTAPEGSYSTNPDGATRVLEFREMVQSLNQAGLRVVMDVVYNHTNASGLGANSVLDKVVPGYYHRLNGDGNVERSTCCDNTASENYMMEKLMIDSVITWTTAYKVDGYRFDLMGHHMLSNMTDLRAALDGLTVADGGVDGKAVYVYGEGWDFGEVASNARGTNATQLNIGGTGIGVFNDRLRDAARGGGPFGALPEQGFLTGLLLAPNEYETRGQTSQQAKFNEYTDWIRIGLAGNLADYTVMNSNGYEVPGKLIGYNGSQAGYTKDPQENIVYVSAHDNETLWDVIQAKSPAAWTTPERVRMHNLGISLVMLSQGVPFFHAGDELLRSKSLDRNSYNSGDWFNKIDFTYQSNNWAVGLPPSGDNADKWDIIRPLLANPDLQVSPDDIQFSLANFETFLKIRKSSRLFRLQTADDVSAHMVFFGAGKEQTPGLIAYWLKNDGADSINDPFKHIVVVFNATIEAQAIALEDVKGQSFMLHPELQNGADEMVRNAVFENASGLFNVPPRTTAVFVVDNPDYQPPAPAVVVTDAPVTEPLPQPEPASNMLVYIFGAVVALLAGLAAWFFGVKRKKQ
ncbi:MAG: pullulanase-type alpha-1,6-glucosidase [Anaerolineae bacterium]|nr:pullulanase-type alpha-1,6-glucosidase [Anaerolineae bacterium]